MLIIKPLTLKQANDAVALFHRHHKPVVGHRFSIGVYSSQALVGVAIVGRPVGWKNPQYDWCEVTRLATDETKNACSKLYSACARAADAMGFVRIQTFILESENGASLKASGWTFDCWSAGGDWNGQTRTGRRTDQPLCRKQRWFKELSNHDFLKGGA